MKRGASDYILWSQFVLYASLLVCLLIEPKYLFSHDQGGVSNYGSLAKTVVVYSFGFIVGAGLLVKAASLLKSGKHQRSFGRMLRLLAVLYIANLVSTYPYKLNHFLDHVHVWAAVLLLSAEMIMGIWLVRKHVHEWVSYTWLLIQIVGFLLLVLTFTGKIHLLFIAEVWPGIAFGALLVRTADVVTKKS